MKREAKKPEGEFQVKRSLEKKRRRKRLRAAAERRRRHIQRRLAQFQGGTNPLVDGMPEISAPMPTYEMHERVEAIPCGTLPAVLQLVVSFGLVQLLNEQLKVLKLARPYQDSDHVLNIALNVLCGGTTLDDIEVRRQDAAFLNAIGARSIPDPTTAGDYCRRFGEEDIWRLLDIFNQVRILVWHSSTLDISKETARVDVDGTFVVTNGECREGMDISYKGEWGYHPLVVTLENTGEPLFIVNRPGNRPSSEGAPEVLDKAIDVCRRGGFRDILLRGDTDFTMTAHLDRWDADEVRFVFGYDASPGFVNRAESLHPGEYQELVRKADQAFSNPSRKTRAKQPRIKSEIVRERGYLNKKVIAEDLAEFEYKPTKAKKTYRIIVLRKLIEEERGQLSVGLDFRYFFYVTNDRNMTPEQVVAESNGRCKQEKLLAQLKSGTHALHSPVNTLNANWAYMVMAALAWSIKAWVALSIPSTPRWKEKHESEQRRILHMGFRTFLQAFIMIPAQVVKHGRRLVLRMLAWRPELPVIFRLLDAL